MNVDKVTRVKRGGEQGTQEAQGTSPGNSQLPSGVGGRERQKKEPEQEEESQGVSRSQGQLNASETSSGKVGSIALGLEEAVRDPVQGSFSNETEAWSQWTEQDMGEGNGRYQPGKNGYGGRRGRAALGTRTRGSFPPTVPTSPKLNSCFSASLTPSPSTKRIQLCSCSRIPPNSVMGKFFKPEIREFSSTHLSLGRASHPRPSPVGFPSKASLESAPSFLLPCHHLSQVTLISPGPTKGPRNGVFPFHATFSRQSGYFKPQPPITSLSAQNTPVLSRCPRRKVKVFRRSGNSCLVRKPGVPARSGSTFSLSPWAPDPSSSNTLCPHPPQGAVHTLPPS